MRPHPTLLDDHPAVLSTAHKRFQSEDAANDDDLSCTTNDTELRFKRSMREAFPSDYATSAIEQPEAATSPMREAVEILAAIAVIAGLIAGAWWS